MSFEEFVNKSEKVDDAFTCGKVLLHTKDWDILFICDFCQKNLSSLLDLLRHALTVHVDDVPPEKLQELCGIKAIEEVNLKTDDCDTFIEESLEDEVKTERLEEEKVSEDNDAECNENNAKKESKASDYDNAAECNKTKTKKESKDNEYSEFGFYLTSFKVDEQAIDKVNDPGSVQFQFTDVKGNDELETREQSAASVGPSNLTCTICYANFINRQLLMDHKKTHGKKPFLCQQCGATFIEKRNMKEHIFRHLGIKPFVCQLCKKSFTSTTELKIHIRSHTGERPYKCSECDKAFTISSHLNLHRRRTHTNERRNLCQICGKTFRDSTQLKNHSSTHSSARPHKCTKCDSTFSARNGLQQHMLLHSEMKKYNCKLCGKSFAQFAGVYSHMKAVHKNEKNGEPSD